MPDQIDEAPFLRHSSPRNTFRALSARHSSCCIFSAFDTTPIHEVHFAIEHLQEILTYPFKPLLCSRWSGTCTPSYVHSRAYCCAPVDNHWSVSAEERAALAYPRRELGSITPTMALLRLKILAFLRSVLRLVFGDMSCQLRQNHRRDEPQPLNA